MLNVGDKMITDRIIEAKHIANSKATFGIGFYIHNHLTSNVVVELDIMTEMIVETIEDILGKEGRYL